MFLVFQLFDFFFQVGDMIVYVCILGLSYNTNDDSLRDAFSSFGDVTEGKY